MRIRRLLSLVLVFALTLCFVSVPAYAAEDNGNWSDDINDYVIVPFTDLVNDGLNAIDSVSDTMTGIMGQNFLDTVEFWSRFFGDAASDNYDDYVSTLPSSVVTAPTGGSTVYSPEHWTYAPMNYEADSNEPFYADVDNLSDGDISIDSIGGLYVLDVENYLLEAYSNEFAMSSGVYSLVYASSQGSANSVVLQGYDGSWHNIASPVFSDNGDVDRVSVVLNSSLYSKYRFYAFRPSYTIIGGRRYVLDICVRLEGVSSSDPAAPSYPSSTRPADLMQIMNTYNQFDYSTKYYIGSTDGGGNVTNIYAPNLFDEEIMIFTEPVSGNQYQCTNWTYNYYPYWHDYILDIAPDTFYASGEEIVRVCLAYGDDGVTILGFSQNALNTLIASQDEIDTWEELYAVCTFHDTYSYVIVEETEVTCEHTYTYEALVAPTCLSEGQRRYTCSLCGNTFDISVPAVGHTFTYEVETPATCISPGERKGTCSVCGTEVYEEIPQTDHTYRMAERVQTEYDEDGNVVSAGYTVYRCTTCGSEYTESDEVAVEDESWFSWLGNLFKKLISSIVDGLAAGLEYLVEKVIVTVTDLIIQTVQWVMDLLSIENLTSFFGWFSDDNETFYDEFGPAEEVDIWAYS